MLKIVRNKTIFQVDSFADYPFKGNPAGVMIVDSHTKTSWMQNIAMEMNLSETAFIIQGENDFLISFFTPLREELLCGHATLASAHILYETGIVDEEVPIKFKAKGGELLVHKENSEIVMNLPIFPVNKMRIPNNFKSIVGFEPIEMFSSIYDWTIAVSNSEIEIKEAKPIIEKMISNGLGNLMITAKSDQKNTDFVVRCFAPISGINEDPVTGSAHCALAPLWYSKTGKKEFNSLQLSKRTGRLKVKLTDDSIVIKGHAITMFQAELKI
jgi:predicted PhzF superfamily epimerase YddE/YHI9